MKLSLNPSQSQPKTVLFGQSAPEEQDAVKRLRRYFQEFDDKMASVHHLSANEAPPETAVTKALGKIRRGWLYALASLTLLVGGGGTGIIGQSMYQNQKPSSSTIRYHDAMYPDWDYLVQTARRGRELGQTSEVQAGFADGTRKFISQIVRTLGDTPPDAEARALAAALKEKIENSPDFKPKMKAGPIAGAILQYITNEAKLPPNPSDRDIELALENLRQDFIEIDPTLKVLSDEQKSQLGQDIKQFVRENRHELNYSSHNYLVPVLVRYLGSGIAGISFKDFQNLRTEKDAIRLFKTITENEKNFPSLTPEQRKAFLKYGEQILNALASPAQDVPTRNYPRPNPLFGMATLLLIALGGLGGPGLAILKKSDILGIRSGRRELDAALKIPFLLITNADQADVENKRRIIQLNDGIAKAADAMVPVMQAVAQKNPEVRHFLRELFTGEQNLPGAKWFRQFFDFRTVQRIWSQMPPNAQKAQKPIGELRFLQEVAFEIEAAYETGAFLQSVILEEVKASPEQQPLTGSIDLRRERKRIDDLIAKAMMIYCNRLFGEEQAKQAHETLQAQIEALEKQFLEAHKRPNGNAPDRFDELKLAQTRIPYAKRKYEDAMLLAEEASGLMKDYILPLRQYRLQLTEIIDQGEVVKSAEELQQIQGQGGKILKNRKLKQALKDAMIQKFIREDEEKNQKIRDRVREGIASQLEQMGELAHAAKYRKE